jgi:beta-1,4-mannosyltransferase
VSLNVLFMPVIGAGNPYQDQLAAGLAEHGVRVRMARGYLQLFPLLQAAAFGGPRPDVLHLHWTHPYLYWSRNRGFSNLLAHRLVLQLRLVRRSGIRIVWTLHNIGAHDRDDPRELRVARQVAALADTLIAHCQAARDEAIEALQLPAERQERLVVIPHGHYIGAYPSEMSRDEARRSFGFGTTERVYLMFGRLRRYKGTDELLEAFRQLEDPNARLLLAGRPYTPEVRAELEAMATRDPRVIARLEFIPDVEIQRYMRAADVAVLPFRDVLTSGSVVLAMSFGLPVIGPRLGCLPETLGPDGRLLYDPAAPDGLAGSLRMALTADLAAIGASNRAQMNGLDWREVAQRTIELAYGRQSEPVEFPAPPG